MIYLLKLEKLDIKYKEICNMKNCNGIILGILLFCVVFGIGYTISRKHNEKVFSQSPKYYGKYPIEKLYVVERGLPYRESNFTKIININNEIFVIRGVYTGYRVAYKGSSGIPGRMTGYFRHRNNYIYNYNLAIDTIPLERSGIVY